jgi:MFS family permease
MGEARKSLLSKNMQILLVSMILANTGSMMTTPLLALYVSSFGATIEEVGLFFTLASIFPLAVQIIGGWLSDTIGRLNAIAIGSVLGVVGYLAQVVAPTFWWLLLAQAIFAITRSLVGPSFSAFTAEESGEETRGRTFGITQTLFNVVHVIGPALGGWIADRYGFRVTFAAAGVLYLLATIIRVAIARRVARETDLPPSRPSLGGLWEQMRTMALLFVGGGVITWILLIDGVRDIAFRMSEELAPVFLERVGALSVSQIGFLGSVMGMLSLVASPIAGALVDRFSEKATIALGTVTSALGFVAMLGATNLTGFAVSSSLLGASWGLMDPAYQSLISKAVPSRVLGTAYGFLDTSLGLVSLPAPWLGGQLWTRFTARTPFFLTTIVLSLSVWPIWAKFRLGENNHLKAVPMAASGPSGGDQ